MAWLQNPKGFIGSAESLFRDSAVHALPVTMPILECRVERTHGNSAVDFGKTLTEATDAAFEAAEDKSTAIMNEGSWATCGALRCRMRASLRFTFRKLHQKLRAWPALFICLYASRAKSGEAEAAAQMATVTLQRLAVNMSALPEQLQSS